MSSIFQSQKKKNSVRLYWNHQNKTNGSTTFKSPKYAPLKLLEECSNVSIKTVCNITKRMQADQILLRFRVLLVIGILEFCVLCWVSWGKRMNKTKIWGNGAKYIASLNRFKVFLLFERQLLYLFFGAYNQHIYIIKSYKNIHKFWVFKFIASTNLIWNKTKSIVIHNLIHYIIFYNSKCYSISSSILI